MNIVENGNIDWSMFGMSVKNYRREKGLDTDQFAELINRVNGGERDIINGALVEKIEAGKAKPSVDHLIVFDQMVNHPGRTQSLIQTVAETFMFGNNAAQPTKLPTVAEIVDDNNAATTIA